MSEKTRCSLVSRSKCYHNSWKHGRRGGANRSNQVIAILHSDQFILCHFRFFLDPFLTFWGRISNCLTLGTMLQFTQLLVIWELRSQVWLIHHLSVKHSVCVSLSNQWLLLLPSDQWLITLVSNGQSVNTTVSLYPIIDYHHHHSFWSVLPVFLSYKKLLII